MPDDTRPHLSRDAVVAAAADLADSDGLAAVSMRRVADALDAGAMSLYNHVADKDDLLAGMLEHVLDERSPALGELPADAWRPRLRAIALDLLRVLGDHPWASELWNTAFPGPARTALMEHVLATLRNGGFSPRMAHHGLHAFDLYVVGYAHQEANFTIGLADPEATMQAFLDQTPVETFPYTIEHVQLHAEDAVPDDDFTFMLDLLLDGIERHHGEA